MTLLTILVFKGRFNNIMIIVTELGIFTERQVTPLLHNIYY